MRCLRADAERTKNGDNKCKPAGEAHVSLLRRKMNGKGVPTPDILSQQDSQALAKTRNVTSTPGLEGGRTSTVRTRLQELDWRSDPMRNNFDLVFMQVRMPSGSVAIPATMNGHSPFS